MVFGTSLWVAFDSGPEKPWYGRKVQRGMHMMYMYLKGIILLRLFNHNGLFWSRQVLLDGSSTYRSRYC